MNKGYDLAIIGAGPAALSAAVYASRYGMSVIIFEQSVIGGQVATANAVDNYLGFPDGIAGLELAGYMEKQAKRFGANIQFGKVTGLENVDNGKVLLRVDIGDTVAKAVLIAAGSGYRHLGIPGEDDYAHYCATCDGAFYKGKNIITVGGANAAVQETLYLAKITSHVTMLVRSYIKSDQTLKDKLDREIVNGKVSLMEGWQPLEIISQDNKFVGVRATNGSSDQLVAGDGIFIFAGQIPNSSFLASSAVQCDEAGYVLTDNELHTSMTNVWAAGDIRSGTAKQIATASADGARAAMSIRNHFREIS